MEFLLNLFDSFINRKDHTFSSLIFQLNCMFILIVVVNLFFPVQEIIATILENFNNIDLVLNISTVGFYCALFLFFSNASLSPLLYMSSVIADRMEESRPFYREDPISVKLYRLFSYSKVAFISNFDLLVFFCFILYFFDLNKLIVFLNEFVSHWYFYKILMLCLSFIPALYSATDFLIGAIRKFLVPPFVSSVDKLVSNTNKN